MSNWQKVMNEILREMSSEEFSVKYALNKARSRLWLRIILTPEGRQHLTKAQALWTTCKTTTRNNAWHRHLLNK